MAADFSSAGNNHKPQILQEWKWRKIFKISSFSFSVVSMPFSPLKITASSLLYIVDDTIGADIAFAGPFQDVFQLLVPTDAKADVNS